VSHPISSSLICVFFARVICLDRQTLGDRLPTFSDEESALLKGSADLYGLNYVSGLSADFPTPLHCLLRRFGRISTDLSFSLLLAIYQYTARWVTADPTEPEQQKFPHIPSALSEAQAQDIGVGGLTEKGMFCSKVTPYLQAVP